MNRLYVVVASIVAMAIMAVSCVKEPTMSFKDADVSYPNNKSNSVTSSTENLIVGQVSGNSSWAVQVKAKFTGSSFPLYSDIELNYNAMGVQRQQLIPMGALIFKIGSRINEILVWPVVMTIEGDQTKEIVGYSGQGVILNTGEGTTPVAPALATGSINLSEHSSGEFGGVVIGSEQSNPNGEVSGVYLYDQTSYTPSNVFKTDGSFNLGGGAITCKVSLTEEGNKIKEYTIEPELVKVIAQLLNSLENNI